MSKITNDSLPQDALWQQLASKGDHVRISLRLDREQIIESRGYLW